MSMEGKDRADAVTKMMAMMTQDMINMHVTKNHPGGPMMTMAMVHAGIEKDLKAA